MQWTGIYNIPRCLIQPVIHNHAMPLTLPKHFA